MYLQENGCEVVVGVLQQECHQLNKRFFTYHDKKRPFIILKWAETKDGFIDKIRNEEDANEPNWISNAYSQQLVHKLRAEEHAILIGTTTAINDNPSLTVRKWSGINPIRIVIDRSSKIPTDYELFTDGIKTIIFSEVKNAIDSYNSIIFECINFNKNVPDQICAVLFKYEIQSLIIEGGAKTIQSFIDANLWDEAFVFIGDTTFKEGLKAPSLKNSSVEFTKIDSDIVKHYKNY